jgi:hypothetical protein
MFGLVAPCSGGVKVWGKRTEQSDQNPEHRKEAGVVPAGHRALHRAPDLGGRLPAQVIEREVARDLLVFRRVARRPPSTPTGGPTTSTSQPLPPRRQDSEPHPPHPRRSPRNRPPGYPALRQLESGKRFGPNAASGIGKTPRVNAPSLLRSKRSRVRVTPGVPSGRSLLNFGPRFNPPEAAFGGLRDLPRLTRNADFAPTGGDRVTCCPRRSMPTVSGWKPGAESRNGRRDVPVEHWSAHDGGPRRGDLMGSGARVEERRKSRSPIPLTD